jgi:hypothetical protein
VAQKETSKLRKARRVNESNALSSVSKLIAPDEKLQSFLGHVEDMALREMMGDFAHLQTSCMSMMR